MKSELLLNRLECIYCDKKFTYNSERKRHEKSHTPQFKCKSCGKVFGFVAALRRHEQQHKRAAIVECDTCNKQFKDDTLLQRHIKYAHGGNHTCDKCNTTFPSKLALRAHMKSHNPVSERKFKCMFKGCSKAFNYMQHLKHHELTHTDTKSHYCNACGKGFIQYHHLKTHLKLHEPEKWLPCLVDSCVKKFPTEYSRRRHLKTHKVEEFKLKSDWDSKETIEKDKVFCETCGSLISRQRYPKHCMVCKKEDQYEEILVNVDSAYVPVNQKISNVDKVEVAEKDNIHVTFDGNVSTCISFAGQCLVKHELRQDCLCAQIKHEEIEIVDFVEPVPVSDYAKKKKDNKKLSNNNSTCDSCFVLDLSSKPCLKENTRSECCQSMPKIEYVSGGIVKIKELFDESITVNKESIDYKAKSNVELNNTESMLFNSCKAVLGKCLASEDGTMGKGCLCAEMLNDNYPLDSQQIDEITPNPNMSR